MYVGQFLTRVFGSLALCYLLASGIAGDASAQTHSSTQDGWRITVDESPSPEFVAQALADLQEFFPPFEPAPDQPWCCYVGNYGGMIEPDDIDDEDVLKFFRLTDDLDEESTFFRTFWSSTFCDEGICSTLTQFNLVQGGPTELMTHLREAVEPDFDPIENDSIAFWKLNEGAFPGVPPIDPSYMPPTPAEIAGYFNWKVEYGVYPVYVGSVGVQYVSPAVWSVTLSAAPEPSSAMLCLVAATMFGLRRRRARLGHRPHAA